MTKIAPEFYDPLPKYESWPGIIWDYVRTPTTHHTTHNTNTQPPPSRAPYATNTPLPQSREFALLLLLLPLQRTHLESRVFLQVTNPNIGAYNRVKRKTQISALEKVNPTDDENDKHGTTQDVKKALEEKSA